MRHPFLHFERDVETIFLECLRAQLSKVWLRKFVKVTMPYKHGGIFRVLAQCSWVSVTHYEPRTECDDTRQSFRVGEPGSQRRRAALAEPHQQDTLGRNVRRCGVYYVMDVRDGVRNTECIVPAALLQAIKVVP